MASAPVADCAWCDAAASLEPVYSEMGVSFCTCSCCGKLTQVNHDGTRVRVSPRKADEYDVAGALIDGP